VKYIAQGWKVTDLEALADIGRVPDHETPIEIPEDVLKFYARRYQGGDLDLPLVGERQPVSLRRGSVQGDVLGDGRYSCWTGRCTSRWCPREAPNEVDL
jgi:hypothetical protein